MTTKLNHPTLVLNKGWMPLTIETARESLIKAFTGSAKIVDENYIQYNWEEWSEISEYEYEDSKEDDKFILTANYQKIKIPEVIVLLNYNRLPNVKVKLTRRNLLIRDKFTCQYTGQKLSMSDATIDHVVPRTQGGLTTWDNVVICSFEANVKKGGRTPEEAGLTLKTVPRKPSWSLMFAKYVTRIPKSWEKFIKTDKWNEIGYWDVELVD
jgi:5-methylcytosine-specific restriction endonuclease McrA